MACNEINYQPQQVQPQDFWTSNSIIVLMFIKGQLGEPINTYYIGLIEGFPIGVRWQDIQLSPKFILRLQECFEEYAELFDVAWTHIDSIRLVVFLWPVRLPVMNAVLNEQLTSYIKELFICHEIRIPSLTNQDCMECEPRVWFTLLR